MPGFVRNARLTALLVSALATLPIAGCESYRVEYRTRPEYYREAAMGGLPDRVQLDDGTVLVYRTRDVRAGQHKEVKNAEPRKEFKIREEFDDGTIVLRALLPEHIIANFIECLDNEEYELIYTQLLSEHTRLEWEGLGHDVNDFAAHFAKHRSDMRRSLMRIYLGISQLETVIEQYDNGVIEARLSRRAAGSLKFTSVRMIREGFGLKLLTIR